MRFALGALPLLTFLAWTAALYLRGRRGNAETATLRNAVLQAAALLGLWVALVTEALSVINQLKFVPILVLWIIAAVGGVWAVRHYYDPAIRPRIRLSRPKLLTIAAALPFFVVLSLVLTSAIFNPPNNYDSYSYHLTRQFLWLQHANVRFYSTNNLRQLIMAPFAEYVGVHLMALSNSDRWGNLVQFAALLITFCGVSLLTERLGGNRSVQFLACLILLVDPIVFLEASNTKNDIVVGMWIVICTVWLIRYFDRPTPGWFDAFLFGCAIGCCGDTKGTGPLFVLPIVVLLCAVTLYHFSARRFQMLCVMGIVSLAISLPPMCRNYFNFGHVDGPPPEQNYLVYNTLHAPKVVISNLVRQFAWNAAIPPQEFDDRMFSAVTWLHVHFLGLGISDKRTTSPASPYRDLRFRGDDEDRAGSPLHLLLLVLLPVALWLSRRRIRISYALLLCGLAVAELIIFSWFLNWQEWNVRFFVAPAALFAPVLAAAFSAWWRALTLPVLVCALVFSIIPTVNGSPRRFFGPSSLFLYDDLTRRFTYFGHNSDFVDLARFVGKRHMHWVGFATDGNFPDYAVMYTLKTRIRHVPNFEYVNPFVPVAGCKAYRADIIITTPNVAFLVDRATGTKYVRYRVNSLFAVLLPRGDPAL